MARTTIRDNVEWILAKSKKARNCDKTLMVLYWKYIDNIDLRSGGFPDLFIEHATSPESIRRARQLIQEEGLFMPTEEVALGRRSKQSMVKNEVVAHREMLALK